MVSVRIRTAVIVVAAAAVASFGGVAGAQSVEEPGGGGDQAALKARIQGQNVLLDERVEDLASAGAELEDTQARVYGARARAGELRDEMQDLRRDLVLHRETFEASKAIYEEQARAAYRGDDLEGLAALIGDFLGGGDEAESPTDIRLAGILLAGQESLEAYEDDRQTVRNTIRQLAQKKSAYNDLLKEENAEVANLRRQEARLDAAIARIRSDRDEAEARLEELKARERARIRKARSATGGDASQDSGRTKQVRDDKSQGGDGVKKSGGYTLRETESQIARDELFVQPVKPISQQEYLKLYKKAARDYGFARDWYILAAVGKVESNHGEYMGPSSAGAMGPMQFLPSTWEGSGVDGNGDGRANIMDPRDAIPAAAGYLRDGGAPDDWYAALYSYNHADWYVQEVLAVAEGYRELAGDDRVGPYI